jgi:hypothetical protein
MMQRPAFSSFGKFAATPDGEKFVQLPTDLLGDLSKALQFAYRALLRAWNNLTLTDASRREILNLINQERAEKKRPPITNLRTVTWYFSVLKELGIIDRRYEKEKDAWFTENTRPVSYQFPPAPPKPKTESGSADSNLEAQPAAKSESEVRQENALSVVRTLSGYKWYALLNDQGEPLLNADGKIDWKKGDGWEEPAFLWPFIRKADEDVRALIASDPDVRALVEAARPARE